MLFCMIGLLFGLMTYNLQAQEDSIGKPIILFMAEKDGEEKIAYREYDINNGENLEIVISADMFVYDGTLWEILKEIPRIGYFKDVTGDFNLEEEMITIEGWLIKKAALTTKEHFLSSLTHNEIIVSAEDDICLFLESLPDEMPEEPKQEHNGIFSRAYHKASAKMRSLGISVLLWYLSMRESLATFWSDGE